MITRSRRVAAGQAAILFAPIKSHHTHTQGTKEKKSSFFVFRSRSALQWWTADVLLFRDTEKLERPQLHIVTSPKLPSTFYDLTSQKTWTKKGMCRVVATDPSCQTTVRPEKKREDGVRGLCRHGERDGSQLEAKPRIVRKRAADQKPQCFNKLFTKPRIKNNKNKAHSSHNGKTQ